MSVRCPQCGAEVTLVDEAGLDERASCVECGFEFVPSAGAAKHAQPAAPVPTASRSRSGRGVRAGERRFEFRAGDVIGRSFSIWSKNLIPFSLLSWLVFSPVLVLEGLLAFGVIGSPPPADGEIAFDATRAGVSLFRFLLQQLLAAALIAGVFQRLRGRPTSLGASLDAGMARLLPAALVSFFYSLAVVAALPFLIFPALFVGTALVLGVPATVVEKTPVFASLGRSWRLSRGVRLPLFLALIVVNLLVFLLALPAGMVIGVVLAFLLPSLEMIQYVASVLVTPLHAIGAVALAVAYHDARVAKEGIGTDELAAVFD